MKVETNYNVNYSKFDIEQHKKFYHNYFEAVILDDGTVQYAVPSHQEKLIEIACNKHSINRNQLCDITPKEYYGDWMLWLSMYTGTIPVWDNFYIGEPNQKQIATLKLLKLHNIYKGKIFLQKTKRKYI